MDKDRAGRYTKNSIAQCLSPLDVARHYGMGMYTVEEIRLVKLLSEIKRRGHGGQAQLGRAMGVSPAQIQQWVKRVRTISSASARRLERALGKPVGWMDGCAEESAVMESAPSYSVSDDPSLRPPVPLISWAQAGNWTEFYDSYLPSAVDEWVKPSTGIGARAFALTVRGEMMEPEFTEGDTIFVDPAVEPAHGSFVIVQMDGVAEATFKQLIIDGGDRLLKPLNPRYPVVPIVGEATLVGVVLEKRKEYRR